MFFFLPVYTFLDGVVQVGFVVSSLELMENSPQIQVCVNIMNEFERDVVVQAATSPGSAQGLSNSLGNVIQRF